MGMNTGAPTVVVALLGGAILIGCANRPTQESTGAYVDDSAITTQVMTALGSDPVTKARDISVKTYRGVVQLSGFVASDEERHEAVQDARQVKGVRDVEDEMQVRPRSSTVGAAVSDSDLTLRVKSALMGSPDTKAREIDVTTENGVVLLSGFVDSNEQRDDAANVAKTVQGVKAVDNGLQVKPPPQ
jgi:hyperosmotically inducible periplasmic protein